MLQIVTILLALIRLLLLLVIAITTLTLEYIKEWVVLSSGYLRAGRLTLDNDQ
jgi:hypothetical protein